MGKIDVKQLWKTKKKWILILLVCLLLLAIGCGTWYYLGHNSKEPVYVYPFNYIGMTEYWGDSQESYGPVTTDKIQTVFLSDTQTVTEILVKAGDMVKKGDLLMTFDTTLSDLALERKRLDVEKLKLQLEDAYSRLREINAMKPMVIPEFEDDGDVDTDIDLGYELENPYKLSNQKMFDGSTPEKALICWIRGDTDIDDGLFAAIQAKAREYQQANVPEESQPEESEPQETKPEETEPEETEPEETEPEETEPEETEPEETEPEETEPEETEPEETEPEETEPEETEPEETEPEETEPEETEPQVTEPQVTEPQVTEPQVTEPQVTEPQVTEPQETEPQVTEPKETTPEDPTQGGDDLGDPDQGDQMPSSASAPPAANVSADTFYVVLKITAGNMSLGDKLLFQGLKVTDTGSGYRFRFVDAAVGDHMIVLDSDEEIDLPEMDFGSGYTAAQIAELRSEQEKKIKDLQFDIKMAEAEYKIAQTEMSDGNIYSEIDGEVVSLLTEEEAKKSQQPVLKVSGGGGFYIEGTVSELEKDKMQIGQEVTVNDWNNGTTYTGTVASVGDFPSGENYFNGIGNPNASQYPFTVFVDGSADLQAGRYASITFSSGDSESGIYLENPFIRREKGQDYVLILGADGKLEQRFITTGKSLWGSYTEVRSGLTPEDMIAFPYGKNVKPGVKAVEGDMSNLYG